MLFFALKELAASPVSSSAHDGELRDLWGLLSQHLAPGTDPAETFSLGDGAAGGSVWTLAGFQQR